MSVVHAIDTVTEWARANICDHILLKQPPADMDAAMDSGYEYTRVHPAAFPLYMPKKIILSKKQDWKNIITNI